MKNMSVVLVLLLFAVTMLIISFNNTDSKLEDKKITQSLAVNDLESNVVINSIGDILLPEGFERIEVEQGSFSEWLRNIKLRKDNTIYLYNGKPKDRQDMHYRVLDISTGSKDLQQCADCIMRLQAEYYFEKKEYSKIIFPGGDGTKYNFEAYAQKHNLCHTHECLLKFLETVFSYCGTYTIEKMTKHVSINGMQVADVFLKAGSPGHAMIVTDMAVNKATGIKIYLLAQGYMPAQDMHIVINPTNNTLSPWYEVNDALNIITPGWIFNPDQLRR